MSSNDWSYFDQLPETAEGRSVSRAEFREEDGEVTGVRGHAATFNEPYRVRDFREQIAPGAFDDVLNDDVLALVNHNPDLRMARSTSEERKLELSVDDVGLVSDFPIPDHHDDVRADVRDGVLQHMSFAFQVGDEEWGEADDGTELRTIKSFDALYDVSIVAYPANHNTDVALRSRNKWRESEKRGTIHRVTVDLDADVSDLRAKLEEMEALAERVAAKLPEGLKNGLDLIELERDQLEREEERSDEAGEDEGEFEDGGVLDAGTLRRKHELAVAESS